MINNIFKVLSFMVLFYTERYQGKEILNDYIRHYETLNYDRSELHSRHRRAVDSQGSLRFNLNAHGRVFRLNLQRDHSIFSTDHVLEFDNSEHHLDTSFIYTGHLLGEANSAVHGSVINGTFRGEIHLSTGTTFYIENADNYFSQSKEFHSIIYNLADVNLDPYKKLREAEGGPAHGWCGVTSDQPKWQAHGSSSDKFHSTSGSVDHSDEGNIYSSRANVRRTKRAASSCTLPDGKSACVLYLRSDPILFNYFKDKGYTDDQAKDEIMAIFSSHVKALNSIYEDTKFVTYNRDRCYTGIQFRVTRTKIMTDKSEKCAQDSKRGFCNEHLDVSNVLNLNSQDEHDSFCLAYVFTRRDFSKGTLGLAWVASEKDSKGGICEKYSLFSSNLGPSSKKSLNTGVVTLVNYQKPVAPRVSQLTFAHEVGHNFGSPHDDGLSCAPYGTNEVNSKGGNYIMFASATKGDDANNNKFSECSRDNITRVLHSVLTSSKNCFQVTGESFCGNGIVEGNEECDCGFDEEECRAKNDTCCHPRKTNSANQCKLKTNAECSPSQGPCCTNQCRFVKAADSLKCKVKTDCAEQSYCTGGNATCPEPKKKPDRIFCDGYAMTCDGGLCNESVCAHIGWKQCYAKAKESDVNYRDKLCYVSCTNPNKSGECVSSADVDLVKSKPEFDKLLKLIGNEDGAVKLPPGSPCDELKGYCDVFSKCRGVDAEGPLARLKNLIFSKATLKIIREWIQSHWWAVLLMSIGVVLFMGLFIYVCSYNTPSSNPNKPPPKFSDTLRRLRRRQPQNTSNSNEVRVAPDRDLDIMDPPPPYSHVTRHGPAPGARSNKRGGASRDMEMRNVRR